MRIYVIGAVVTSQNNPTCTFSQCKSASSRGGNASPFFFPNATMHNTSIPSGMSRMPRTTSEAGVPSLRRRPRICTQHDEIPISSACNCMEKAAILPSSTQQSLALGQPVTTTAKAAYFKKEAPLSLASDSFSRFIRSSTNIKCHERLFIDVGDIKAALMMVCTSSPSSSSELNDRQLLLFATN